VHFIPSAHYPRFPNMNGQVTNLACFPPCTASRASSLASQLSLCGLCPEAARNLDKTYKTGSIFSIPVYSIFLAVLFTYSCMTHRGPFQPLPFCDSVISTALTRAP